MVLFRDINKASSDVLTRDFVHGKPWEAEVKSASAPFTFTQVASAGEKLDANTSLRFGKGAFAAETKFFTNGASLFDLKYTKSDLPAGVLILNGRFDIKTDKKIPELSVDFAAKNNTAHAKLAVNPLAKDFVSSSLFAFKNFKFGGEVSGNLDLSKFSGSLGLQYVQGNATCSLKTASEKSVVLGKVIGNVHVKSGSTESAAEATYDVTTSKIGLAFGGKYVFDKDSSVKAKLTDDAKVAVSFTHAFSPLLTATLGFQTDALDISKAGALKYGAKFSFNC